MFRKEEIDNVSVVGYLRGDDLKKALQQSLFVVLSSEW
jgi:hypothetical protein